ncbi:MBL fold metallo-hydrolase RNA specificity domain-containing protein [Pelagicoccus mobilis]|uniref:MBL fold metallo-hydrolase n=1 Tax=Pelagicoccus mobilis TaxID=415221 RepID=A0A934S0F4_9BACT|nr:MBL fold metallo-hydrolase [Pelagicoccus mobilis]MBK1877179.1 MBL fold metallo-hydrolase [Pelagicoccus mobilis]
MKSTLTFLGAAGTVTGSRHLLETRGKRLLIDCGLFQGPKQNRLKNWDPFPIDASSIDAILLTHAHIDHIGYLPRLVKEGFRGPVYATHPTVELAHILLRDTAHLQTEEAKWANKKGYSKHQPALPLYTERDAERATDLLRGVSYGDEFEPISSIITKYRDVGHILGSAFLGLKTADREDEQRKLLFSGDIGRPHDVILRPPSQTYNVDYLVMESTYGDRLHDPDDVRSALRDALNEALTRGAPILIPSFAVGRSQSLLYLIRELEEAGEIPSVPVFLDSPMALKALQTHENHIRDLNLSCRRNYLSGTDIFSPKRLTLVSKQSDSKALVRQNGQCIIIAGSGMATGGRILHHLRQHLPNPHATVLFVGYQAEGTRGHAIREGKPQIKMFGQYVDVRAQIRSIDGFSGHADYLEMLAWLMAFNKPVKRVFLTHGQPEASEAFGIRIREQFNWPVTLPRENQPFEIDF